MSILKKTLTTIFCLTLVAAVLCDVLMVVPAPNGVVWLASVAAVELSLWFSVVNAVGLACGLAAEKISPSPRWQKTAILVSAVATGIALIPTIGAYAFAIQRGIPLSVADYFWHTSVPLSVAEIHDVTYRGSGKTALLLDIYSPSTGAHNLPVIVVIHGGAWCRGRKSDFASCDRWLAANGYVVFDVNYRLASENSHFPDQILDVENAMAWIYDHAGDYGGDGRRMALMGRSAGGQLALLAAYRNSEYGQKSVLQTSRQKSASDAVRCVVSFYAPTDLVWDYYNPAIPDVVHDKEVLTNFLGGTPETIRAAYEDASPIKHVTARSAPTLLIHGGRDQMVLQKNMYFMVSSLKNANVPVEFMDLWWVNHGFDFNYSGWGSQLSRFAVLHFLKKHL